MTYETPSTISKIDECTAYEKGVLLRNKYRFVKSIQQGSYGNVSLALDTTTNTEVAIKAMNKSVHGVTPVARHEVSILSRLGYHPNICQLLDSFETSSTTYLVLEYCSGGDLHDRLHSQGGLSSFTVYKLASQLKEALNHSHQRGVYHRDIKPENILFSANGDAKLADWGLATLARSSYDSSVGTEKYMAPECFVSSTKYDTLYADYWSFGMTLLFAIFGKAPFTKPHPKADNNFKLFSVKRGGSDNNDMDVLYDIYPDMSAGCLEALVPVLSLIPSSRNLEKCVDLLNDNWSCGLTVDEEYELEMCEAYSDEDDMFEMDDAAYDDVIVPYTSKEISTLSSIVDDFSTSTAATSVTSIAIPSTKETATAPGIAPSQFASQPPPSLIGNSYMGKSWSDIEDEDDDDFFFQFESMSLSQSAQKPATVGAEPVAVNCNTKLTPSIAIGSAVTSGVTASGERNFNWF
ncbi:hypothetical protein BABINDRAFT_158891 [Babjeviella inositovora NRRL Y-12698]|uniref:Protein kinase domain-containing protein n=1 Tax=Babjeviella inositovora NRRL Y-12698 TaxID=984486 RepID=A0A1E3QX69_9ASCO|nr:uncharacterized protein BABINDRAFT_158891 [Babjeviella inositovora NRRL Y-12698]ODQ82256.1 hypothetical protein BABINDRAFT_158891 [Babjeviella inositovora NRRL Y-12698]